VVLKNFLGSQKQDLSTTLLTIFFSNVSEAMSLHASDAKICKVSDMGKRTKNNLQNYLHKYETS